MKVYQPEVVANSYTINILFVIESKLSSSGSQIKLLFKQSFFLLYILFEQVPRRPLKKFNPATAYIKKTIK